VTRTEFLRTSELFESTADGQCRVCGRDTRPPLREYCSHWCQHVAEAVSSLFDWGRIREWVIDRDGGECVRCGWRRGDGDRQLEVDHIVPQHQDGHPFDPSNLQTLCTECHAAKSPGQDFRDEADRDAGVDKRQFRTRTLDAFAADGGDSS